MCDPLTIVAGAGLAISAGSQIVQAKAQSKAAGQNKQAALAAMAEDWKALSLQETQQQDAATATIMDINRQAQNADALARASAGEAGVAGASVDAVLGDIGAQASRAITQTSRNLDATIAQLQQEKRGAAAGAQSRINAVQPANPFAVGLSIGGQAIDFAMNQIRLHTPPKGSG